MLDNGNLIAEQRAVHRSLTAICVVDVVRIDPATAGDLGGDCVLRVGFSGSFSDRRGD
jgi:hypothetical protein